MTKNVLRTSRQSSLKPSDSTFQRGEINFKQSPVIQCLQTKMSFFVIMAGLKPKTPTVQHSHFR